MGGWISGRGWSQDKRGLLLHATALYLDWHTETELGGLGSVLALAPSHKGKSWGGHTLTWKTKHSLGRSGVDIGLGYQGKASQVKFKAR